MNPFLRIGQSKNTLWRCLGVAASCATLVSVTGCANQPAATQTPIANVEPPVVITQHFETDTLYSLLVAELAGSRDRLDIMLNNYIQQAIDTQDAGVTERAAQLASYMHKPTETLQMASQWASLDPKNPQARYMAMATLTDAGRYFEAFEHGQYLLNNNHEPHGLDALAAKASQPTASAEDAASLTKMYENLHQKHPRNVPLVLGLSFLQYKEGNYPVALTNARDAQKLQPTLEQAYYQELRILEKVNPAQGQQRLGEIVAIFPQNKQMRLQYARDLTQTNLAGAAVQFEELFKQTPDDANIALALALTLYQQGDLDKAKGHFLALTKNQAQADTARYYLGKIATQQNAPLAAIDYFLAVKPSKEFLPALAHAVQLMHEHDQKQQALQVLLGYELSAKEEYQEGIALLLADHYKNTRQSTKALNTYNAALIKFPQSLALLYNRAMFLAELNNTKDAERDFKTVIAINPDHSEALNSLGYLLADSNQRLPEAMSYIERAIALDPENPATIDSLGWVHYRSGNLEKAITFLRQAFQKMPNDEIAAHLGEVLWMDNQKKEAVDIWKHGLGLNPNSRFIIERLQRFKLVTPQPEQPSH